MGPLNFSGKVIRSLLAKWPLDIKEKALRYKSQLQNQLLARFAWMLRPAHSDEAGPKALYVFHEAMG